MIANIKTQNLLDLQKTIAKNLFKDVGYPWEVLPKIKEFIIALGLSLDKEHFKKIDENIWVSKSATIFDSASLTGPLIIDDEATIRHCAFIRGSAVVGKGAVVGNSCEVKNSILFDYAQIPHFNYCGDSILGFKSHIGAGGITSNLKSDKSLVVVKDGQNNKIETNLRKFGAILGDRVEVGCNRVLNPGSIVGRDTNIYPTSNVRGFIPANSIYKSQNNIIKKV